MAADQPMRGGMAPTMDPTQVLTMETRLSGVYTLVYRTRFNNDNAAASSFTLQLGYIKNAKYLFGDGVSGMADEEKRKMKAYGKIMKKGKGKKGIECK